MRCGRSISAPTPRISSRAARRAAGRGRSSRRLPAIVEGANVKNLIQVLEGHAICDGRGNLGSLLVRQLVDEGMQRVCIVPIPPDPQVLVGILLLAWRTPPDAAREDQATGAALEVAGGLVTRWQK